MTTDRTDGLDWWQDVADTLPADVLAAVVDRLPARLRPEPVPADPGAYWSIPLYPADDGCPTAQVLGEGAAAGRTAPAIVEVQSDGSLLHLTAREWWQAVRPGGFAAVVRATGRDVSSTVRLMQGG